MLEDHYAREGYSKSNGHRRRGRSRSRDRSRRHKSRSRSKERRRDKNLESDRGRHERRHSSRDRDRHRSSRDDHRSSRTERRQKSPELSPEERDARTVFVWQLSARIRQRDLEDFFTSVEDIKLIKDPTTNRSQGYGFVTYVNSDDAKKALDQLNGFELAGRPMKVNHVTERSEYACLSALDNDEADRSGVDLGTTGRLALMAKLAEGTGLEIPKAALAQLHIGQNNPILGSAGSVSSSSAIAPPVCTQCFMLSNMFDPHVATHSVFEEIRDDVIEECTKAGGCLHIFVDRTSAQGNVYVKCPSIAVATQCVNMLHGRYFSGRLITAAYVPLINYHQLFPDSVTAKTLLHPSS
ncbi:unnamed protein product [Schistosoma curassoni]|uniref:RRM domain-containing protein n=1 Tax=Schistosoma curassoni TaxID=6186 RepID=A0A183L7A3_9TREM|nr:unnamed protein product [Schistosoma curassoni]